MDRILQVNIILNSGSTGRIAEEIGLAIKSAGIQSYIAAAYTHRPSKSNVITVGNRYDRVLHASKTRLFDRHGFGSKMATLRLIERIKEIAPDLVHLHNIHGYYLHIDVLFNYLRKSKVPVVWTLHDCWPFTGHCPHFERVGCFKWKDQCYNCPNRGKYPASWLIDRSRRNYKDKKQIFTSLENLCLVVPSHWLEEHVRESYLKEYEVKLIYNGINLSLFKHERNEALQKKYNILGKKIFLGVAGTWNNKQALTDFYHLSKQLKNDEIIVLVGLNKSQLKKLPYNIIGVERTENISMLTSFYSMASVFINPTYADNFPSTNIEALACGTPVVTYDTGGSSEAIDNETGAVVERGNVQMLYTEIQRILSQDRQLYTKLCRKRAEGYFNKEDRYSEYLDLYRSLINSKT